MRSAFYQPSGRVSVLIVPALLVALCLAAAGALAYAWIAARTSWCLSIVTIWPFAFWLRSVVKTAGYLAKVRNPVLMREFGVVVGLFGWVSQWAFWIVFMSYASVQGMPGQSIVIPLCDLFASPSALSNAMGIAFSASEWGDDMDAALLRCVGWPCELSLLSIIACEAGASQGARPFCESSQRWATVTRLPYKFADQPLLQGLTHFVANPGEVLARLSLAKSTRRFAVATLYSGKYEDFISVEAIDTWTDGKRRRQRKEMVVNYLRVPRSAVNGLLQRLSKRPGAKVRPGGKKRTQRTAKSRAKG